MQPTRELLKAREGSKRSREEKVLEWQRGQLGGARAPVPIPPELIKREGERAPPCDPRVRPPAPAQRHDDSDSDSASEDQAPQR